MKCSRILTVVTLAGCNLWVVPLASAESQNSHIVQIVADPQAFSGYGFQPSDVFAEIGDTVTFKNVSDVTHTVTDQKGSFTSGDIKPGGVWIFTVSTPGQFKYICTHHRGMGGLLLPASLLHPTATAINTVSKPAESSLTGSDGAAGQSQLPATGGAASGGTEGH